MDTTTDVGRHYDERTKHYQQRKQIPPDELLYRKLCNLAKDDLIKEACLILSRQRQGKEGDTKTPSVLEKEKETKAIQITQLDLGCGKGGDVLKSAMSGVTTLVGIDPSKESLIVADARHAELCETNAQVRNMIFATCQRADAFDKYLVQDIDMQFSRAGLPRRFDMIGCQFALHYGASCLGALRHVLSNIAKLLVDDGIFLGIIMDSDTLYKHWEGLNKPSEFGNSLFKIRLGTETIHDTKTPCSPTVSRCFPTGTRIHFTLAETVVDCPEFIINKIELDNLARDHGLAPVDPQTHGSIGNLSRLLERRESRHVVRLLQRFMPNERTVPRHVTETLALYTSFMYCKI